MKQRLKKLLEKLGRHENAQGLRATYDSVALARFARYARPEIPWTTSAVAPRALAVLANEVIIHRRRNVLECGCGISTLVLGELLEPIGGRITTIDDDENWLAIVRDMTAHLGNVDFIHAPLREQALDRQTYEWYDRSAIYRAVEKMRFDMVFVDGPKAKEKPFARYPARAMLEPLLAEDFVLFLDDSERDAEKAIAEQWANEGGMSLRLPLYRADLAILRPKRTAAKFSIV